MDRHNEIKIYLLVRVFNERMDLFVLAFICLSVTRFFCVMILDSKPIQEQGDRETESE